MLPLPQGNITFLFTDIEGSTRLWEQHPDAMRDALAHHDALLQKAIESHGGHVFKRMGDSFCAAFASAAEALAAAVAAQRVLHDCGLQVADCGVPKSIRVRMALHTGVAHERDGDYFGPTLNRVARILAAAHGGQILLSAATEEKARDSLPESASLRDLAAHRLRDLARPERIFQLVYPDLSADFPPLRSLEAFAHNLPSQLTSFIGREREMAEVKRLLAATRLLTLTGAGGCGKTRLALQVAADLVDAYADGVWLVDLAPLADPSLVPQAVAAALGLREEPGRPVLAALSDYLRPRSLLLLLDNCEHLVAACAELANTLLCTCSKLEIVATSRETLGIAGEIPWRVPSLGLPEEPGSEAVAGWEREGGPTHPPTTPFHRLLEFDAVRLFVDRATSALPSFTVTHQRVPAVVQVCQRLDGIPLAIELAAARVKALSVEQIALRLDDRFRLLTGGSRTALPRQQTLQALIDWSYDLLTEPEQVLLRRLSVFAGGWTLETAEAVCSDPVDRRWLIVDSPGPPAPSTINYQLSTHDVLDLLSRLVDKSLVVVDEDTSGQARYRLLETVRQYARDKLREGGEGDAVRDRHLDHFLRLAEAAEPHLFGGVRDKAWVDQLEQENDNLRAAFEWCEADESRVEAALRLGGALHWFWFARGHIREGTAKLGAALQRRQRASPAVRAKGLTAAGYLAVWQGDYASMRAPLEESLAIVRQLGDPPPLAYTLCGLGAAAYYQGDPASARSLLEESMDIARKQKDWALVSFVLYWLGLAAQFQGDYASARSSFEAGLAMCREVGYKPGIAHLLNSLGRLAYSEGNYPAAHSSYAESLAILQEMGDRWSIACVLDGLVRLAAAQGEGEQAARLFGAVAALREAIGALLTPVDHAEYERDVAGVRAALGEERFAAAAAEGRALSLEESVALALKAADPARRVGRSVPARLRL